MLAKKQKALQSLKKSSKANIDNVTKRKWWGVGWKWGREA